MFTVSGLLAGIHRLVFQPTHLRKTGYENLNVGEFLIRCGAWHPFHQRRWGSMRSANWARLFSKDLTQAPALRPFWNTVREYTAGNMVYELGVGANEQRHRELCPKLLGCSDYVGVDIQNLGNPRIVVSDVLLWALQAPENAGSVVAFGLFNEPLSPANSFLADSLWMNGYFLPAFSANWKSRAQFEHEYLRRLARELYRIVSPGGMLFGDGILPLMYHEYFAHYLLDAGFKKNEELMSRYQAFRDSPSSKKFEVLPKQLFFFVK